MRIALIQMKPSAARPLAPDLQLRENFKENMALAFKKIREAKTQGAEIAVLPELFCFDYDCFFGAMPSISNIYSALPIPGRSLSSLAKELSICIFASAPGWDRKKNLRLFSICFTPQGVVGTGSKLALYSENEAGRFNEAKYFVPSRGTCSTFGTASYAGIMACSGSDFIAAPPDWLKLSEDLRCVLALSSLDPASNPGQRQKMFSRLAKERKCYVAVVAPAKNERDVPYAAHSMVISPDGRLICWVGSEETTLYCDLDLNARSSGGIKKEAAQTSSPAPDRKQTDRKPAPSHRTAPLFDPQFLPIYEVIKRIPFGNVTTFGVISKMTGFDPQTVSYAASSCRDPSIPCHRVVNYYGNTKTAGDSFALGDQRAMLQAEGIPLTPDGDVPSSYIIYYY